MTPAGYMAKKVCRTPDWLKAAAVSDIYSLSGCISEQFCDYIDHWKHNGYWLFDSPLPIREIAAAESINPESYQLFYYEVHDEQFDEARKVWEPFKPDQGFRTEVAIPKAKHLQGYDVVSFSVQTSPECSPLSCNGLAESIPVNSHCLLPSFEEARSLLERGAFDHSEPGPFRIFAVYSCDAGQPQMSLSLLK